MREVDNVMEISAKPRSEKRMLTFDDDSSEEESDSDNDEQLSESVLDLDNTLPSTSTTTNQKSGRSSKGNLSTTSSVMPRSKVVKRLCHGLQSLNDSGNKEVTVLLKTLLMSIDDLSKDVYQSSKDVKQLVVSAEKVDKKLNVIYDNQKKMQRALTKNKVKAKYIDTFFDLYDLYRQDQCTIEW